MRARFLIAFLAAASLTAAPVNDVPDRYATDQRIARITYKAACRISKYDCVRPAPRVRRSPVVGDNDARGAYWSNSTVVWLDRDLKGTQLWLTIFHEQVHYLQVGNTVDANGFDRFMTCIMEREALDFVNEYARELNKPTFVRTVKVWRELYKCNPKKSNTGMSH
ncbi:hypothetical protein LCGC14_1159140 [marine sediment metagenome]|uniref:Uncharacterized protein n=1 Tax=marine sediment metagenome TaxID=412755 RepID=A0A0F9LT65_9ZZZZ